MKKIVITLITSLAMLLILAISACAVQIGEISYTLTTGETEAENTAKIDKHENTTFTETDIVIPEYVEYEGIKYYVTEMANFTFKNTNITTVVFDDECGIKIIPTSAFYNCDSLTLIDFGNAQITTLGSTAFAYSEKLVFKDNRLPVAFEEFSGAQHFDNCNAMTTLIFPESFTDFNTDTRIQNTPIVNLVFEGKMTNVYLKHNAKQGYGGMNIYLTQNTVDELNGSFVETLIYNNQPYFRNEKDAYTTKTSGSLTLALSSNNANSGGNEYKDANGVQYSRVNTTQDRIYFCTDGKVVPVVRSSVLSGSWTNGYMAVYDANALEVPEGATTNPNATYKFIPHFAEKTITIAANCTYTEISTTYCYCGAEISKIVGTELGDHVYTLDGDCTTAHSCTVCLKEVVAALEHKTSFTIAYANGYIFNGEKITVCENENCEHEVIEVVDKLLEAIGYSTSETDGYITHRVRANKAAIEAYELNSGKTVQYGVVAAIYSDGNPVKVAEDGTISAADQAVVVKMTNNAYNKIEIKLTSLPQGVAVNCNAYFVVDNKVSYICGEEVTEKAISKTL